MEAFWSEALSLLREKVGERNYSVWIEPIRCRTEADVFRLEVPSRFFQDWITRHFLPTINEVLSELAGRPCEVRTVVKAVEARSERITAPAPPRPPHSARPRGPTIGQLVPQYTFRSFVVGEANEVAFKAAQAVSAAPGRRFNPVFLHGGVGLGKTHLINAVGHELLRRWPRIRIACLPAESFMNDLINALRQDQMGSFRGRFRKIDALILDDVQFLAGKERTQEEFFHTFNELYGCARQIVLTSDKPPSAISNLEARLRSRFEGGLIADIHPPTREMRLAIARAKAAAHEVELTPEVADYLVRRTGPSVRELEGALTRLIATAAVRGEPITLRIAEETLGPLLPRPQLVSIEEIQQAVSLHFGLAPADLLSQRRDRRVALPRQIAMYLSRTVAEASFPSIAQKFGGRDHSTVMHAVKVIELRRNEDAIFSRSITQIEGQLRP